MRFFFYRRVLCGWVLAVLPALGFESNASAQSHQDEHPSVFLITIDTLRADHVHCYGYGGIETPAMDSLAADGMRFDLAFTPVPITSASHASILTGLRPSSHGVTDFGMAIATERPTWAELLKAQHYQTAAFIGAVVLDSKSLAPGFNRGFDFYYNFPEQSSSKERWGRVERRAMNVVTRAEKWMGENPHGPTFVWVHLYDPHDPYEPPEPFATQYKQHPYDGEIAYADSALQHFLKYLKQTRRYENSLIIVVGDHGEGLGEHNEDTHGIFLYDSTTRVPLIIKLPRASEAGKVVGVQVRTIDILPTVLDVAHVANSAVMDGKSLRPLFDGSEGSERIVFVETDYPIGFGWAPLRSIRAHNFKFIETPKPELYDLRADPGEQKNNYQAWDPKVKEMRAVLAEDRARKHDERTPATVGECTLEELKALGYLGRADVGSATNVPEPSLLPDAKDKIEGQNLLHRAMLASEAGRKAEASSLLEKTIEIDPDFFEAQHQLGALYIDSREYTKAAPHLEAARRLRPQDFQIAYEAGVAQEKANNLPAAREALEASLKRSPQNLQGRILLGEIYLKLGNTRAAADQYQAALLLQPESLEAQLGLVRLDMTAGNSKRAIEALQELEKSHPHNREIEALLTAARQARP